jgi:hypothetical protein
MLKIELRQHQEYQYLYPTPTNPLIWAGTSPNLVQVAGLSSPTWTDVTEETNGLQAIDFNHEIDGDSAGGGIIRDATTKRLTFVRSAAILILEYLVWSPYGTKRKLDVRFFDDNCGRFTDLYEITSEGVEYCDDVECYVSCDVKEQQPQLDCLKKTLINQRGGVGVEYFDGTYKHPRFGVVSGSLFTYLGYILFVFVMVLVSTLIAGALSGLGTLSVSEFVNNWLDAIFGTRYVHPAVLNRIYIQNICKHCGLVADDTPFNNDVTSPNYGKGAIFNSPASPYYNSCWLELGGEGVKWRNDTLTYYRSWDSPVLTAYEYLQSIAKVHNADFKIIAGKLFIQRKDYFENPVPLLDLTVNGSDRTLVQGGVCFNVTPKQQPAYMVLEYSPSDSESDKALYDFSAKIGANNNPQQISILGEPKRVTFDFSPVHVIGDGLDEDPLESVIDDPFIKLFALAMIPILTALFVIVNPITAVAVGALLAANLVYMNTKVNEWRGTIKDRIILDGDTASTSKLLIWDASSGVDDATVAYIGSDQPAPNPYYNPVLQGWDTIHTPSYTIGTSGIRRIYNYPYMTDERFWGTLFNYFYYIDDVGKKIQKNKTFDVTLRACCELLNIIGFFANRDIVIGRLVSIDNGSQDPNFKKGVILSITTEYINGNPATVVLKGETY